MTALVMLSSRPLCRTATLPMGSERNRSFVRGQMRLRRCGSSRPFSIGGRPRTSRPTPTPIPVPTTRRSLFHHPSRHRLPTPLAHTHRHPRIPFRWQSELPRALNRRLPSSRPSQRMLPLRSLPLRSADPDARAFPPRTCRHRRLRWHPLQRRLLPPHLRLRLQTRNRNLRFRTSPDYGVLLVRQSPGRL